MNTSAVPRNYIPNPNLRRGPLNITRRKANSSLFLTLEQIKAKKENERIKREREVEDAKLQKDKENAEKIEMLENLLNEKQKHIQQLTGQISNLTNNSSSIPAQLHAPIIPIIDNTSSTSQDSEKSPVVHAPLMWIDIQTGLMQHISDYLQCIVLVVVVFVILFIVICARSSRRQQTTSYRLEQVQSHMDISQVQVQVSNNGSTLQSDDANHKLYRQIKRNPLKDLVINELKNSENYKKQTQRDNEELEGEIIDEKTE